MKPKYTIGDQVWISRLEDEQQYAKCEDCGGDKYVTVIANGETFTVPCEGCKKGWMGPSGVVPYYSYVPRAESGVIGGVEVHEDSFEYRIWSGPYSSWIKAEAEVFTTEEEALVKAAEMKKEHDAREIEGLSRKRVDKRSWAWHVTYYKREIKTAQETIRRATEQLNVAKKHVREMDETK